MRNKLKRIWKNINKTGRKFFVLNLQYLQFGQDGWRSKTFFMKICLRWTCSQIFRKFSYWETLFWMMLNTAYAHLKTLSNNIYTRKSSSTDIYLFKVSNRNTEKNCEICLKLIVKTPERLSTFFIVNFGHISPLFLLFCCWLRVPLYQIIKAEITYGAITDRCAKIWVK